MRSLVLGAGPAGLTAGYSLAKAGADVTVLEADAFVGGLARTEVFEGNSFDIGGHRFFTKLPEVRQLWKEMLGDDFIEVARLSRILYRGELFHYPLRPLNALAGLGLADSVAVTLSYLRARLRPTLPEESFENYVSNRFGRRLYEIFFKTYTEKVWGVPCSEIRAEWAAQRIQDLTFFSTVRHALLPGRNGHIKSLVDRFEYPRLGPGMMWNRFRDRIEELGGKIRLGTPVVRLHRRGSSIDAVTVRAGGREETLPATHVVSTIALRDLVRMLEPAAPEDVRHAADALKYRDFLTVLVIVRRRELFPDQWIYVHTPEVSVGRIQNFKNWSADMVADPETTTLGLEYFVSEGDDLWSRTDDELVALARRELETLRLVRADEVSGGAVRRVRKAYPVYDRKYRESLSIVRGYLDSVENLFPAGRNGLHKYNNQDHSMLTALLAARNALGETHDVWDVNSDLEYQEQVRSQRRAELLEPVADPSPAG